jgi:tRNA-2-methylthio-N6-dimethylallyladenosine synthase
VFSFQYSPRPNTSAAHMPNAVPDEEKGRRLIALQKRQKDIQTARNETLIGQTYEVLVDGASRRAGQWAGRTSSNRVLNFTSPRSDLLGQYIQVRVTHAGPNSVAGEQVI